MAIPDVLLRWNDLAELQAVALMASTTLINVSTKCKKMLGQLLHLKLIDGNRELTPAITIKVNGLVGGIASPRTHPADIGELRLQEPRRP